MSFLKINEIEKSLARLKQKEIKINKSERGYITANATETQRIMRDYCEQLHPNKLDNLEEIDKFLKTCELPSLNHEETGNLNRSIINKEIKSVIKKALTKKSPGPHGFMGKYYQTLTE